jgi:Uma2 family endonuclease
MKTLLEIGPRDHGRPLTLEEFTSSTAQEGYRYELIDGRLCVSSAPNAPQGLVERWIYRKLDRYTDAHPEVLNLAYSKARVFIPGQAEVTAAEPDVAAYRDFPLDLPLREIRWEDVHPTLVVEVLSEEDPDKDLVRNVELYLRVSSIQEYWILDTCEDPDQPTLTVYRRYHRRWRKPQSVRPGSTYTTDLLPGLSLIIDPRT